MKKQNCSLFLKIFLLMLSCSAGPCLFLGLYELVRFHKVIYGRDNPLMIVLGVSILLSIIVAGLITKDITAPIKILIGSIKNYRVNKTISGFEEVKREDEFGYLFDEYEKMIVEVSKYQKELEESAHLAAIGRSTAMVAHDVRRPLASVKALLNVLPKLQYEPERVRKMAAEVDRTIANTNALLNDIMDFSKDSTALNLDDHGPDSVITAAVGETLRSHPEAEVKLEYDFKHGYTPINADAQRIIRVLINILGNSLEAMSDKTTGKVSGHLSFRTYITKHDGNEFVAISIADNGSGIPEEALSKLFDPFFTQGKKGGTGLGLAICQKIVDMHKGKISAKNCEGRKGAEFTIEIPVGQGRFSPNISDLIYNSSELKMFRVEETQRQDYGDTANTLEFMRINKERQRRSTMLVLDDEPLFRESIREIVNSVPQVKDNVKVIEVDSAETGLKVFEATEFDYVIADIDLGRGKMNGYTFAQKILKEHPRSYVLIHSNKRKGELDASIRQVSSERFLGFLSKPMKSSDLLHLLACKSFESIPSPLQGERVRERGAVEPSCQVPIAKSVLLVNDDEAYSFNLKCDLKDQGLQVITSTNVSDALKHLSAQKFDLILSDINLEHPTENGYEFLAKVREKDKALPFIFMSGYSRDDEWYKAEKAGASDYIQLPFEMNDLLKMINGNLFTA